MSFEYRDGTFSDNMPLPEALEKLAIGEPNVRALHVGTPEELDRVKQKKKLLEEVKGLEARIAALEDLAEKKPVQSSVVVIPTRDEMIEALRSLRRKNEVRGY